MAISNDIVVLFKPSERARDYRAKLLDFMDTHFYPAEPVYEAHQMRQSGNPHHQPQIIEDLTREGRSSRTVESVSPAPAVVPGLSNLDYAPLAEIMGRSPRLAPEACNCNAPDTGNMEVLTLFGTDEHKRVV